MSNAAQLVDAAQLHRGGGNHHGEQEATWDYVVGRTYTEPTYPDGGSLVVAGVPVETSAGASRFRVRVPAYAGYSYEVYGNPTFADLSWSALPFSLTQDGTVDRSIHTATGRNARSLRGVQGRQGILPSQLPGPGRQHGDS